MDPHDPELERTMAQAKLVGKPVKVTTNSGFTATVKVIGLATTGRPFARVEDESSRKKFNLYYDELRKVE
jgi:hypothetical protein